MSSMTDAIQRRIDELKAARDEFLQQANREIAAMNGALAELERLAGQLAEEPGEGD